jgi:hypothetical protein
VGSAPVRLLATGDLIIDEPDPAAYFDPSRALLQAADVVVGHVEVPFTLQRRGTPNVPLEARDPAKLKVLAEAGVDAASLSANHLYDEGEAGVRDTLHGLCAQGILPSSSAVAPDSDFSVTTWLVRRKRGPAHAKRAGRTCTS